MNLYTIEKLQELERERLAKMPHFEPLPKSRKPVFGFLATGAGRALRRAGEGLESWGAAPQPEHDHSHAQQM
ncbi:MAG: hypothetical protein AAB092_01610 [Chloroflexota bacterium]